MIIISMVILIGTIFLASWVAVMGGFEKLEEISVERNIARSQEVIADRLHNITIKLADWTVWGDTYAFIENKNETYIKSNLTLLALETIKIDMMLFFNLRGELVYSNNHESDNKEVAYLLSGKFKKQLDVLLTQKDAKSSVMGIVMLPEGPALVVSKPIVKSDGKGPVRGALIFVSRLDAEEIMYLNQVIRAEMSLEKMNDVFLPSDFAAARAAFLKGKETFIDKIDAKTVAGYSVLKDISGKRILILRVSMPREIVQFGVRTMGYFFVALIIVGLIFGTAVYVPLERELAGRDRAEKAAGASERKFQNLVETSFDWVWECDKNGIYTYVSPRIKDLLGYEVSEVLGKTPFDFMPEEEGIKIREIFKEKLVNKETFHGLENANRHKDGHLVILETSGVPIFDEHSRVKGYRGIDRNITERKKAERELVEAKALVETVVENIPNMIFLKEATDLRFIMFNRAGEELLGYDRKQLLGKSDLNLFPPGQAAYFMAKDREVLDGKAGMLDIPEEPILTAKKGERLLHTRKVAIRGGDGVTKYLLGISEDITERQQLIEALKKSHENLESQVRERTEELARSFQKLQVVSESLQQASKAKSEFLANMSHELRTPLNSIIGFSEVLYDERFGPLNERQKKYTQNVMASGRHLLSLINEVLDLSKVEAGKMALEASSFSILGCIEEVLRQMESQALFKKIKTALEVSEDFDKIHGDERKIKQVIYNLLSNAIKFTPPGGKVGIRGRRIDNGIEVTVWDTGIGILPENLEKAFGAFERLGSLYVQETEGTGLGLTISRKMVELHGGKIWIESGGLGKGTAVKFTIPSGGMKWKKGS